MLSLCADSIRPRRALVATAAAVVLATGSASAGFIDFDEVVFPGVLTTIDANHYASMGVVFHEDPHLVNMAIGSPGLLSTYVAGGGTLNNAIVLSTSINQTFLDISFFMPGTGQAAFTDSFSALFFDAEVGTELGYMEAYGLNGELLASVSMIAPPEMVDTLLIETVGIHRIRIGTDPDGNIVDNLSFGPLYAIPTPGVLALFGLVGLTGRRRRR